MEELTTAAYSLLKSYVLPGKAYDIVEAMALQMALAQNDGIYKPQIQIDAMKGAVAAIYDAQAKITEEHDKLIAAQSPAHWDEDEMEEDL